MAQPQRVGGGALLNKYAVPEIPCCPRNSLSPKFPVPEIPVPEIRFPEFPPVPGITLSLELLPELLKQTHLPIDAVTVRTINANVNFNVIDNGKVSVYVKVNLVLE